MSFLIFKSKQKTPHELVRIVKDAINRLDGVDKKKVG
jgi:calcium binding protein 39